MEAFPDPEGTPLPSPAPAKRRISPLALTAYILSGLLGIVFLFSAVVKFIPISFGAVPDPLSGQKNPIAAFEWLIRDTGWFPGILAGVAARILIALELLLGCCLLFSYRLRR